MLLLLSLLLSMLVLVGCSGSEYPPVESTEEESAVLMTFDVEGEKYELKYELYRALFLNNKSVVDGGDSTVWVGDSAEEYAEKIDKIIINSAAEIFSVLHHAKKIGLDPYSAAVNAKIDEYIKLGVEGGDDVLGYGGDYGKYLNSLKEMNLNYSAHILIYRYAIAYDYIIEYYKGTVNEESPNTEMKEGAIKYTDEELLEFYESDDCVRVFRVTLDGRSYKDSRAKEIREKIASFGNEQAAQEYMAGFTPSTEKDVFVGVLLGKYSSDEFYYSALTEAAFSLGYNEVSEPIRVVSYKENTYVILYKTDKPESFFTEHKGEVKDAYVSNEIGKLLSEEKESLIASKSESGAFSQLEYVEIKMP